MKSYHYFYLHVCILCWCSYAVLSEHACIRTCSSWPGWYLCSTYISVSCHGLLIYLRRYSWFAKPMPIVLYDSWLIIWISPEAKDSILQQKTPNCKYNLKRMLCTDNANICVYCLLCCTALPWFNDQYFTNFAATWQNTCICVIDYCTNWVEVFFY